MFKDLLRKLVNKEINREVNEQINCRIVEQFRDITVYEGTKEPNNNLGKSGDIFIKSIGNK